MEQATFIALIAAVIVALVEVFKRSGLAERWAALIAVSLGVIASTAAASQGALLTPDAFTTLLTGLIAGLTAAGTYSGARATTGR